MFSLRRLPNALSLQLDGSYMGPECANFLSEMPPLSLARRKQQATEVAQAVALDPTDGTVLLTAAPVQATAPPRPYGDF